MEAIESALKGADTGERAFDNVRKALRVVLEQLRSGGPEEQAFAEHLRNHLSIGFECLYSQLLLVRPPEFDQGRHLDRLNAFRCHLCDRMIGVHPQADSGFRRISCRNLNAAIAEL